MQEQEEAGLKAIVEAFKKTLEDHYEGKKTFNQITGKPVEDKMSMLHRVKSHASTNEITSANMVLSDHDANEVASLQNRFMDQFPPDEKTPEQRLNFRKIFNALVEVSCSKEVNGLDVNKMTAEIDAKCQQNDTRWQKFKDLLASVVKVFNKEYQSEIDQKTTLQDAKNSPSKWQNRVTNEGNKTVQSVWSYHSFYSIIFTISPHHDKTINRYIGYCVGVAFFKRNNTDVGKF